MLVVCPYNFLKSENMGITYLYKNLWKSLQKVEDTKYTMHLIMSSLSLDQMISQMSKGYYDFGAPDIKRRLGWG